MPLSALGLEQLPRDTTPLHEPPDAETLSLKVSALHYLMMCRYGPKTHLSWPWPCLMDATLFWNQMRMVTTKLTWEGSHIRHPSLMPTLDLRGATSLPHAWKGWDRASFGWHHGGGGTFWRCTHALWDSLGGRSSLRPWPQFLDASLPTLEDDIMVETILLSSVGHFWNFVKF